MVSVLKSLFPGLGVSSFQVTSPPTRDYNCIAWAAGEHSKWWWPTDDPLDNLPYWPPEVPREVTLPAFVAAFATLGYSPCDSNTLDRAWEKVAFFADEDGTPTHVCRQIPNGRWTSKLGESEDIEHELLALEGVIYGHVILVMRRLRIAKTS